jgi:hypothetical protein
MLPGCRRSLDYAQAVHHSVLAEYRLAVTEAVLRVEHREFDNARIVPPRGMVGCAIADCTGCRIHVFLLPSGLAFDYKGWECPICASMFGQDSRMRPKVTSEPSPQGVPVRSKTRVWTLHRLPSPTRSNVALGDAPVLEST